MDVALAKELYKFEWELRQNLTGWLQTPMTTLTVLGAVVAFLVQHAAFNSEIRAIFFYSTIAVCSVAWAYAAYSIARSFWGYTYEKLPRLSALAAHFSALEKYFVAYPSSTSNAEKEFNNYLVQQMAEATDRNAANNIRKSYWLNQASGSTVVALAVTGIAGLQLMLAH